MGIRYTVNCGLYKRKERDANGAIVRVERMRFGTCTERTFLKLGSVLGQPTAMELQGQPYTTVNDIVVTPLRAGSVHGKALIFFSSAAGPFQPRERVNFQMQVPDYMPMGALLAYFDSLTGWPSDLTECSFECGRKYPIAAASAP